MLKILVIADIHGEFEKFSRMIGRINKKDFDMVICPGDFTDIHSTPEGYSQLDIAELVLQKILSLKKPLFCVPGNHEPYDVLELFDEYGVNIHEKVRNFKGYDFVGFGGAATPFNTKFEPSEKETEQALERVTKKIKGKFVLVTHNPPLNTKLDTAADGGHVGSAAVRNFILKTAPRLAISAHIHESGGVDMLEKTKLFYPGTVMDGVYGVVEMGKNIKCKTIRV